ncbi:MAG: glutamate--cysteine ligase [Steroidobacteraceae bacterium]
MGRAIDTTFERRLSALVNAREPGLLQGGLKGVERESLRVNPDGSIAHTPHPAALGSALTSEHVTTDFSESLIELVTPAFTQSWELLTYLCDLHQFVYRHLGDELLWSTSMPCALRGDADVPTARFGNSHIGRMKSVYREGLRNRYGAQMQAIAGVHYNYSFPAKFWEVYASLRTQQAVTTAFRSAGYFDLVRNYRRLGWIVLYLFGTSPAVGRDFLGGSTAGLEKLDALTAYGPHATSLRMSDVGYRNRNQAGVDVSLNSLDEYLRDLRHATRTPHAAYAKLGVKRGDTWLQLNTNVLQIENEFYSPIRPKRVARVGESPATALRRGGVEYIEMRALDVSAFDPVGVNQTKLRFLEAFAALCVLKTSQPIGSSEQEAIDDNFLKVARRGREPGLNLERDGRQLPLATWADEILDSMAGICELLDEGDAARPYAKALRSQQEKVRDVERTPSARLLRELTSTGDSFFELALRMSRLHKEYMLSLPAPNEGRMAEFAAEAAESHAKQLAIEAAQTGTFEAYLDDWFSRAER